MELVYAMEKTFKNLVRALILPAAVFVLFFILTRSLGINIYGNRNSIISIMQNTIYSACVAYGVHFNFSSGRLDFSAGAVVILASIIGYNTTLLIGGNVITMSAICIIAGIVFSLIVGILYVTMRLPIIMITLGVTIVYEALTWMIFEGQGSNAYSIQELTVFSREPLMYVLMLAAMLVFYLYSTHTTISYKSRALAFNQSTAVNIGIKEVRNVLQTYIMIGVMLGFGSIMYVSLNRIIPSSGFSSTMVLFMNLFPVIIGFYLAKFCNSALAILIGAITISLFNYGLAALGLNSSLQTIFYGLFMIGFIAYTSNEQRIKRKLRRKNQNLLQKNI